jgi:N-acetylmuramic acid 6-phosphate etherase
MPTNFIPATEKESKYDALESMSTSELLTNINQEDQSVPLTVQKSIPQIEKLITAVFSNMADGGRLFYIGAGTSGRLGVVDASECPPTFGVPHGLVVGLIAGGNQAIRKAVEFAEDDTEQGWKDLKGHDVNEKDTLIGIAASGKTPYVVAAIKKAREHGVLTGCITCAAGSPLEAAAEFPVTVEVGPEFVTGSTRMKAGTAQKLVLNMLSTTLMIKLGRVKGNKMVDMQLSNNKLLDRGARMIQHELDITYELAAGLLAEHGSVRRAIESQRNL